MLGGQMENFERLVAAFALFFVIISALATSIETADHINRHPFFRFIIGSIAFAATLVQVFVAGHIREFPLLIFAVISAITCWFIWLYAFRGLIKKELGD